MSHVESLHWSVINYQMFFFINILGVVRKGLILQVAFQIKNKSNMHYLTILACVVSSRFLSFHVIPSLSNFDLNK